MAHRGEDLYEQHAQSVYRYLFSLCGEADTAEELTQETFCQALRGLDTFRGDCTPLVWLCAIAKRLWFAECRRRQRASPLEEEALSRLEAPDDPAAELETREVIYLRLAGEFSFREIGDLLGRSEVWARVRFYRGKEALARKMGGDGHGGQ